jgi:hypothetical protein
MRTIRVSVPYELGNEEFSITADVNMPSGMAAYLSWVDARLDLGYRRWRPTDIWELLQRLDEHQRFALEHVILSKAAECEQLRKEEDGDAA